MTGISPSKSKYEAFFLEVVKKHKDYAFLAGNNAPQEGFEYFASETYRNKTGKGGNLFTDKFGSTQVRNIPRLLKIMGKNVKGIFGARKKSFTDISGYLSELEATGHINGAEEKYLKSYPNSDIWRSLSAYSMEKWQIKFGFTEVPMELIFKNKAILFKYALVAIQEMDKEKINTAPELDAGEEVLAVYNSLGLAVNDIARWLRKNYKIH